MSLDDKAGWCPWCFRREGPLQAHGLKYFWCANHRIRWTTPARERAGPAEDLVAVRLICQRMVPIAYARSWRPDQGPVPTHPSSPGGQSEQGDHHDSHKCG